MSEKNNNPEQPVSKNTFSTEVADKYELAGGAQPTIMLLPVKFGGARVDFRSITLAQAEKLAAIEGFPYLKLKPTAAKQPATDKPKGEK